MDWSRITGGRKKFWSISIESTLRSKCDHHSISAIQINPPVSRLTAFTQHYQRWTKNGFSHVVTIESLKNSILRDIIGDSSKNSFSFGQIKTQPSLSTGKARPLIFNYGWSDKKQFDHRKLILCPIWYSKSLSSIGCLWFLCKVTWFVINEILQTPSKPSGISSNPSGWTQCITLTPNQRWLSWFRGGC